MRSALVLALLALLVAAPLAAAQVPLPDPSGVVDTACAAVGGVSPDARDKLPVCPRADPAPAQPADPEHQHDHPAAPPATPQDAPALAQDAVDAAQGAAQDPGSAPDRVAAFVATLVQFVKDLLHLPVQGLDASLAGLGHAKAAVSSAAAGAAHAAGGAAGAVKGALAHATHAALDAVRGLLHHAAPAQKGSAPTQLPQVGRAARQPLGLLRDVASRAAAVP